MASTGEFRVPDDVTSVAPDDGPDIDGTVDGNVDRTVDLTTTPPLVLAALALGVVAVPLLGVYAGLFILRSFVQPGVQPDITSTWGGEGLAGIVALAATAALLVVVGRAMAGRGLFVFVGAELVVAAGCGFLLSDDSYGGAPVSAALAAAAVLAVVLALLPPSRRWFAAHAVARARARARA